MTTEINYLDLDKIKDDNQSYQSIDLAKTINKSTIKLMKTIVSSPSMDLSRTLAKLGEKTRKQFQQMVSSIKMPQLPTYSHEPIVPSRYFEDDLLIAADEFENQDNYYCSKTGKGRIRDKDFKFHLKKDPYRVFNALIKHGSIDKMEVLEIIGARSDMNQSLATYRVNDLAKAIRKTTGLTTEELVNNNGTLIIVEEVKKIII